LTGIEIRTLDGRAEELAYRDCLGAAFGTRIPLEMFDSELEGIGRKRTLAAFDAAELVGTAAWFPLELTVPGGGVVEGAGVTSVTTLPTHRRRGVLTSLMDRQLGEFSDAGLTCALLTASEGGIYGRFGYGVGTYKCRYRIDKRLTKFRDALAGGSAGGRVRIATSEEAAKVFPQVWDEARRLRPGEISFPAEFWAQFIRVQPRWRGVDEDRRFYALYEDGGRVLGFADYQIGGGHHEREVDLDLLVALTLPAYTGLWRYLIALDLTTVVSTRQSPVDEPLRHLVTDLRRLEMSEHRDGLWVRPLDVAALLSGRRYRPGIAGTLRLQVHDSRLPQVAGVYGIEVDGSGAAAVTRSSSGSADLELDVAELGSVLLGGVSFASLRAAGRVMEATPGAAWRADSLFASDVSPYLTLGF
jgi:predicted acetyltransferase